MRELLHDVALFALYSIPLALPLALVGYFCGCSLQKARAKRQEKAVHRA